MDGTDADVPCGEFLNNMDLFGGDIPGTAVSSTSNQDCLDICLNTPTCNAITRLGEGLCFPKNLPEVFSIMNRAGSATYRICPCLLYTSPSPRD